MATPWKPTLFFVLNILKICSSHPIEEPLSGSEGPNGQIMGILVAVMVSVSIVFVLLGCVCCKRRSGFKVFRNSPVSASVINETSLSGDDPGHVNPIANAEFTIFTPLSPPHHNNNVFRTQPATCYNENEAVTSELSNKAVNPQIDGIDVSDWFADTQHDFPRSRLKYTRELGSGWFGRVVEGEAHGINDSSPHWTPVAVRILESSASAHEQALFLHEARIYRTTRHPHILQLLGRSLEATPLLLIQEFCPKGDLKKFLLENKECKDSEVMRNVPLQYCCQLASAVQFLHEQNLPHLDLAARTCQITSDLSLKLGDYGLAVTQYPNDYYQGTPSIPVRWCAPESVNHTNTTLQPKQITCESNIWSLAVTFWEICEWGRLPYDWLSDDEVVSQVMDAPHIRLPQPNSNIYYIPSLYRLMEYCWLPKQNRPQINQINSMLIHLSKTCTTTQTSQPEVNDFSMENFDLRWESFKPNIIIKTDNTQTKSASLTNLHGSFENLDTVIQMDSWLENVATDTGDMQYVRGLSQAIHELDTALASEQTSSCSSYEPTPNSSLEPARSETVIHMDDSNNKFFPKRSESESETEDETWRKRIELGAYSEKVKQKSKSVADLMVLTHIDMNTVRDIFQGELKKLQEERRESLLFVPVQSQDFSINSDQENEITEQFSVDKNKVELSGINALSTSEIIQQNQEISDIFSVNKTEENEIKESSIFNSSLGLNETHNINSMENQNRLKMQSETIDSLCWIKGNISDQKLENIPQLSESKLETQFSEPEIKILETNKFSTEVNKPQNISDNFDTILQENLDKSEPKRTEINNKILEEINSENDLKLVQNESVTVVQECVENLENKKQDITSPEHINARHNEFLVIQHFIDNERQNLIAMSSNRKEETINNLCSLQEDESNKNLELESQENNITEENVDINNRNELELMDTTNITSEIKQTDNFIKETTSLDEKISLKENKINSETNNSEIDEVSNLSSQNHEELLCKTKQSSNVIMNLEQKEELDVEDTKNLELEKTKDDELELIDTTNITSENNQTDNFIKEITSLDEKISSKENKINSETNNSETDEVSNLSSQTNEELSCKTKQISNIIMNLEQKEDLEEPETLIIKNLHSNVEDTINNMLENNNKLIVLEEIKDTKSSANNNSLVNVTLIETNKSDRYKEIEDSKAVDVNKNTNNDLQNVENLKLTKESVDLHHETEKNSEALSSIKPVDEITKALYNKNSEEQEEKIKLKTTSLVEERVESNDNLEINDWTKEIIYSILDKTETQIANKESKDETNKTLPDDILLDSNMFDKDIQTPIISLETNENLQFNTELISKGTQQNELALIQNFINNEIYNQNNITSLEASNLNNSIKINKEETINISENLNPPDLTSDLVDTSNVQQINQVFNVFNVTVNHNPPLECFTSPVKNFYSRSFDQNDLITDINGLLESDCKKYEGKNSVCTTSSPNDYLPLVNGINSELSNKIVDILTDKKTDNGKIVPKKLAEIALNSLQNISANDKIANSYEHPKKLSEIVLESLQNKSQNVESNNLDFIEISFNFKDEEKQCKEFTSDSLKYISLNIDSNKFTNEFDDIQIPEKLSTIALNTLKNSKDNNDTENGTLEHIISENMFENTESNINNNYNDLMNKENNVVENRELTVKSKVEFDSNKTKNEIKEQENEIEVSVPQNTSMENNRNRSPKKISEIILKTLNKTSEEIREVRKCEELIENQYLPDIILDNLQNKTFIKEDKLTEPLNEEENDTILINIVNDSPLKTQNLIYSPTKISETLLDTLPCNSPVTSESTDNNISDKTIIEVKITDNNNLECNEEIEPKVDVKENFETNLTSFITTSTPFKSNVMPRNTELNNDNFFSFVSEGDEPSDSQTRVILGPCEDYTLGLYSGLKTTFDKFHDDDRPEEELLQFSSNFMPFSESDTTQNSVDYSLETWDKFLGKSLQDQENCPSSGFENFSPRDDSLDVFNVKRKSDEDVDTSDLSKTVTLPNKNDNETFTVDNDVPEDNTTVIADDTEQVETIQDSWEPGEGWFLHPQTVPEDLTGQIDISGAENIDNSYVGFALDEECVNALRNELAAKLPHAQGMALEEPQEPEDWDSEERNEIIVKYNVYATPLSPIPEESCCDDVFCDQIQHRDESDSESDWSEPCLGQTSQLEEDILVVDTETHTALILESPSLREPQYRHTPSQDSCCSNDTLFNLEDLNFGLSPQHHGSGSTTAVQTSEEDQDLILEVEVTENETLKQFPVSETKIELNTQDSPEKSTPEDSTKSLNKLELRLDPNAFSVAPLPSPEDIPWRQLPASLLTYDEVAQNDKFEIQEDLNLVRDNTNEDFSDSVKECTLDTDLYSNLTDIRFSGPCDTQLMSTSFSESADFADERDWDSGSDTRSSSSGEFIWKEGEHEESLRALHAASHDVGLIEEINPMDAIDEVNSNSSEDSDDGEEDIEETEFVPSAWDAQATPTKSALRSPEKSNKRKTQQKGVWFKKQKYHCVYEYPREPESPVAPPTDLWRPLSDLSGFADWDLDPESCVPTSLDDSTVTGFDVLDKFISRNSYPLSSGSTTHRDLYQLNPFTDFGPGLTGSDEDFFISSSARPFQTVGQSSQFFPGQNPPKSKFLWQDYQSSSQQSSRDLSDGITPDSGIDDITPASTSESLGIIDLIPPRNNKIPPLKCLAAIAANKTTTNEQRMIDSSLGGLRHTRNRLKLDLPPSPNSFTSNRTFAIDLSLNDPVINREIPTFTTFGKSRFSVQHVQTPTDDSDPLHFGKPIVKNVSFEALPHKPLKLNAETVYILDKSGDQEKHKPVEMVQGEASLLDSADEDSGIESSANATLERHQQQILN